MTFNKVIGVICTVAKRKACLRHKRHRARSAPFPCTIVLILNYDLSVYGVNIRV